MRRVLRLAVAQTTVTEDPTDPANLRGSGDEIRRLMCEASGAGARLVQFPEGAITYPGKYVMSSGPPGTLAAADWSRVDWSVMRAEAQSVADLAGELGLWVVFGSVHPLTPPHRPHNSLYVVSDEGALAARYDCEDEQVPTLRDEGGQAFDGVWRHGGQKSTSLSTSGANTQSLQATRWHGRLRCGLPVRSYRRQPRWRAVISDAVSATSRPSSASRPGSKRESGMETATAARGCRRRPGRAPRWRRRPAGTGCG